MNYSAQDRGKVSLEKKKEVSGEKGETFGPACRLENKKKQVVNYRYRCSMTSVTMS